MGGDDTKSSTKPARPTADICPRCGIETANMCHLVWGCHEDPAKWPVNRAAHGEMSHG
jgi:hypothetical protein